MGLWHIKHTEEISVLVAVPRVEGERAFVRISWPFGLADFRDSGGR